MTTKNKVQCTDAVPIDVIRARLDAVLGDAQLQTGLPIAHALGDVFLSEARQQGWGVAETAWIALDRNVIEDLSRKLAERISGKGGVDYLLPPGTAMMAGLNAFAANEGRNIVLSPNGIDRVVLVERTHALGAHGRIEGLARAIINAAPQGAGAVLADLANHFETSVVFSTDTGSLRCRLYWWGGVITAEARGTIDVEIRSNSVTISNHSLPETVLTALPGNPLHVLFDRPFRCDTPIEAVDHVYGDIKITTSPDLWLVNCETGRTWREGPTDGS